MPRTPRWGWPIVRAGSPPTPSPPSSPVAGVPASERTPLPPPPTGAAAVVREAAHGLALVVATWQLGELSRAGRLDAAHAAAALVLIVAPGAAGAIVSLARRR